MPTNSVTVKKVYTAADLGERRLKNFRAARLMFLKQFAGHYYDQRFAIAGDEPINLIFNAISTLVPNLVSNFPKAQVRSMFLAYRGYAELMELGLNHLMKEINLRDELRRLIVDALFTMGIMKTGLATSDSLVNIADDLSVDPGQPYAHVVSFDDFILDPAARRIEEASFVGHKTRVPRQILLDIDGFDHDMVEKLPAARSNPDDKGRSADLSQQSTAIHEVVDIQDLVEVRELWVPAAQAVVWLPAGPQSHSKFLRVTDYYGPEGGPFSYLAFTPPLPDNPMPIAPVGIWYDLHIAANRMAKKIMDQAERQKDILGYRPSNADDAQNIVDAADGDAVGLDDPSAAQIFSFGGQQKSNEAHLSQLSFWFNMMSGNTDQLAGLRSDADTATQAQIMQSNSQIRVEDMRDLVYQTTAKIERNLAWYLHTDPLIALPLVKRVKEPMRTTVANGRLVMLPPRVREEQVVLTAEAREGDFLDYQFDIEHKSMSRTDPQQRLQKMILFVSRVMPAAAQAAMVCQQMGVPFSFPALMNHAAKELDIDWMDDVFFDENFQAQLMEVFNRLPGPEGSKGQSPGGGMGAILQNGQPANLPFRGLMGGSELNTDQGGAPFDVMSGAQPAGMGGILGGMQ